MELESPAGPDAWTVTSERAGRLNRAVLALAAAGVLAAATVTALAVLLGRPTPGVGWLLVGGVPALIAGQLWMIACMRQRQAREPGARAPRVTWSSPSEFFFGPLRWTVAWPLLALAVCGWLAGAASFAGLEDGSPGPATATCATVLENHGSQTCVSRDEWNRAGAYEQQLAGGVLMAFFALHAGAALGLREARADAARARV